MAAKSSVLAQLENPVVSIADQYIALKICCEGEVSIIENDKTVLWTGVIQPTALSREYKVTIKYTINKSPICIINAPDFKLLADDKAIPHIYPNDTNIRGTKLCLFLPKLKKKNKISEWQPTMFVADTIIPWASSWLFYFECWLSSGEWQGGGIDHDDSAEITE